MILETRLYSSNLFILNLTSKMFTCLCDSPLNKTEEKKMRRKGEQTHNHFRQSLTCWATFSPIHHPQMYTVVQPANTITEHTNTILLSIDKFEDRRMWCVYMSECVWSGWKRPQEWHFLFSPQQHDKHRRLKCSDAPQLLSLSLPQRPDTLFLLFVVFFFCIIFNMDWCTMQGIFMHLFAGEFIVLVSSWSWHSEKIPPQIFGISAVKHKDDIDLKWEDF